MTEAALLTDDEIVALCAIDGRPWPLGLTTVRSDAAELTQAGMRGMRSLLLRQLATEGSNKAGGQPNALLLGLVSTFLGARRRVGAYIAPRAEPSALAGAAITVALTADGWLMDSTTAGGVHALRRVSADEATTAVADMAEKACSGEIFVGVADPNAWCCVLVYGAGPPTVISPGGELDTEPIRTAFHSR